MPVYLHVDIMLWDFHKNIPYIVLWHSDVPDQLTLNRKVKIIHDAIFCQDCGPAWPSVHSVKWTLGHAGPSEGVAWDALTLNDVSIANGHFLICACVSLI